MDTEVLEFLQKQNEFIQAELSKAAAATETAGRLHGTGGVFSVLGMERDVITAHVRPSGIASLIPAMPSIDEDPRFGAINGYTDDVGSEPDNVCDDAPTGYMKACTLTAKFGLLRRDSNTIDMGHTRLRINRGDFTDLILRGKILGVDNIAPSGLNESQILDLITMSEMVNVGVRFERALNIRYWQGTVAAGQMPGLDVQIATGQKDAETGTLCPALDSDVKDFAYDLMGGGGRSIAEYLGMLLRYINYNAETMGLTPVKLAIIMRPEMWWELTEVWPCEYNTNKCATSVVGDASRVFIDGRENVAQRDAMRDGMYLDVNGKRYPVVTDTGIFLHDSTNNANLNPGQYASSIYVVPLTITGNFPVLYREYLDYRAGGVELPLLHGKEDFWTDEGEYMWALEQQKFCIKFAGRTEQRIVLRTPQLAGRIDHVKIEPLQMLRSPDPDSPYWYDGGVSLRGHTSGQAVWSS